MPIKVHKSQPSFAGGEYSPAMYPRTDLAKYSIGLKRCRNFIVHPHGGISNRPGTKYVATAKSSTRKCRVIPYVFSRTQAYTLEVGHHYIRFYTDQSQILSDETTSWSAATEYIAGDFCTYNSTTYYCFLANSNKQPNTETDYWTAQTQYEVYTPYTEDDLANLRFESSADVIYITSPDYQTRTLSRYADNNWELELFALTDGPFMPENTSESISLSATAVTGSISLNAAAGSSVFDADQVGGLFKLRHYIEGQSATANFASTTSTSAISCFTTWRLLTHGTWTGKIRIEKSTDGGTTWTTLRSFYGVDDFNPDTYGTEDIELNPEPFLVRVTCHEYTSGLCRVEITTDPFYQDGIATITDYYSATCVSATVIEDFGSTENTTAWSEGSWSDHRGWPRVARFNQDRLCFSSTYSEPQTTWESLTGNYTSFRRHSILLDADGITVNLPSRQLNAINGLISFKRLLAFTSSTIWSIGAIEGTSLTPTTTVQDIEEYTGSYGIDPAVIGKEALYVQDGGQVVRNIGYNLADSGYVGTELNVLSQHLFFGHSITEIAYQRNPDSILWALRDDGILLGMTYMKEQEVVAWHWHDSVDVNASNSAAEIESICVIPADGYDELWMSVKRGDNRFIERMVQRMASTDTKQQFFVDCGVTHDSPITINGASQLDPIVVTCSEAHGFTDGDFVDISDIVGMTELNGHRYLIANVGMYTMELTEEDTGDDVSGTQNAAYVSGGYVRKAYDTFEGLDHLEGMKVAILGDGAVYPQETVEDGEITISRKCSIAHIGLQYLPEMETLNIEDASAGGTTQGRKVKIGQVTFRFINSLGGWIGPDSDNLKEAFLPSRASLGTPPALFTGDKKEILGASYSDGGRIFFQQKDPLPVTISAVIPDVRITA